MKIRTGFAMGTVAAGAAAALLLTGAASARTAPPAHPAVRIAQAHPAARCVTFDVDGQGAIGQWDEPVTFCGQGLPSGMWTCPASSAALGPGTRLSCWADPKP